MEFLAGCVCVCVRVCVCMCVCMSVCVLLTHVCVLLVDVSVCGRQFLQLSQIAEPKPETGLGREGEPIEV